MPDSQQRIQRIAVGFAVTAMLVALLAVVVVLRRPASPSRASRAAPLASRHVSANDLAKLGPETLQQAGDGVRVVDEALRTSLGLTREDAIVAISGLRVTSATQLPRMLRDLGALTPASLFVDIIHDHDREPVVERWEFDGDLAAAPRAGADHGGPRRGPPSAAPPLDPLIVTVKQIDRTTYEVPRSTVEAWTAHPERVAAGGAALGNADGVRIFAIRPGSIPEALGLQDGDLIRGINGVEVGSGVGSGVGSTEKAIEIIARSTRRITLDLQRGGQTVILNYLIP